MISINRTQTGIVQVLLPILDVFLSSELLDLLKTLLFLWPLLLPQCALKFKKSINFWNQGKLLNKSLIAMLIRHVRSDLKETDTAKSGEKKQRREDFTSMKNSQNFIPSWKLSKKYLLKLALALMRRIWHALKWLRVPTAIL